MSNLETDLMTIKNVTLQYPARKGEDGVNALENVSMSIQKGDFVALLGPSGCGKSTLLNIMAGLLEPTTGDIYMYGEKITDVDWRRAVVFQTATLYPWMTTYENVAFGPTVRGIDKYEIDQRTKKYLALVGLTDFAENKPYELSGGMRQRAALARVLVNDPNMILMDEPFGALDALTRINMQALVRDIWRKTDNTVFLITHDVDEALTLGTRVMVMSSRPGRIVEEFNTNFTYEIEEGNDDIRYDPEYVRLRKEILGEIQSQ
ncbi:MAG: ABC transporter ATP-binding protein [Bacillota bacterium]|nr:ABC transporter ATP-binding protein [Bacillota bacterium]